MAVNKGVDTATENNKIDLSKSDIAKYYESDELGAFKAKPMKGPWNVSLGGKQWEKTVNKNTHIYGKAHREG